MVVCFCGLRHGCMGCRALARARRDVLAIRERRVRVTGGGDPRVALLDHYDVRLALRKPTPLP